MDKSEQKFLDFSKSEYRRRCETLQRYMMERNMNACILTSRENLVYFTGYRTGLYDSKFRPFMAVLPLDGEPTLLVPDLERDGCKKTVWASDVRHYGSWLNAKVNDGIALLVDTLRDMRLDNSAIGMEMGVGLRIGMSLDQFGCFKDRLPNARISDAGQSIWKVRMIKSAEEVCRIRKACEITEKSVQVAWDKLKEGITERELAKEIQKSMLEEGADRMGFLAIRSGFAKLGMANPFPEDYSIRKGDIIILDLGAVYRDYWSDMSRSAILGNVAEEQQKVYNVVLEAQQAAIDMIEPGNNCSDPDNAAVGVIRKAGYEKWTLHRTGHGLGLEMHEMPSLSAMDHTILEPGMVLTVEPGLYPLTYEGKLGVFFVENVVVVTEKGHELLTPSSRELYEAS